MGNTCVTTGSGSICPVCGVASPCVHSRSQHTVADLRLWNQIQGNWKQLSGSVKQRWGQLTDDDLAQINGGREQLAGTIQQRYGISQAEANQ